MDQKPLYHLFATLKELWNSGKMVGETLPSAEGECIALTIYIFYTTRDKYYA
jgi:hypothetical protein